MIKNKTILEVKKNERIYQLLCESDSPLGELHDALAEMKAYVVNLIAERQKLEEENKAGTCG